jgi:hypothetical protein
MAMKRIFEKAILGLLHNKCPTLSIIDKHTRNIISEPSPGTLFSFNFTSYLDK